MICFSCAHGMHERHDVEKCDCQGDCSERWEQMKKDFRDAYAEMIAVIKDD